METLFAEQGTAYIADDSGEQGWDKIYNWMQSAADGGTIFINMNGTTIVPQKILELAYTKNHTLVLDMGNAITWTIRGKDIVTEGLGDIDFGVALGSGNVPQELQKDVADDSWSTQMHLAHDGLFGLTGLLTVNIGVENSGTNATLFYYDEAAGKLQYMDMAFVGENGSVTFSFAHASDYVIVVDGIAGDGSGMSVLGTTLTDTESTVESDDTTDSVTQADDTAENDDATESDSAADSDGATERDDTPSTGQTLNAKYILCLGVMLMGIYMILTSKKEEKELAV